MINLSPTYLALYVSMVRELINELNREAASGIITHKALPLISLVDQATRKIERLTDAQTQRAPQQPTGEDPLHRG